jgi:hypothetical protein
MKRPLWIIAVLALAAGAVPLAATFADAEPGEVQHQMRAATGSRSVLTLSEIEARVLPTMRGMQYLGPEYDPTALAYRLKFIRSGRVVFVDVDARTGRIIGEHR